MGGTEPHLCSVPLLSEILVAAQMLQLVPALKELRNCPHRLLFTFQLLYIIIVMPSFTR